MWSDLSLEVLAEFAGLAEQPSPAELARVFKVDVLASASYPDAPCRGCGGVIAKQLGRGQWKVFCSKACCDRYHGLKRRIRLGLVKPVPPCPVCGKEVKRKGSNKKYCSHECYYQVQLARFRRNI